jgi:hypothetical protein
MLTSRRCGVAEKHNQDDRVEVLEKKGGGSDESVANDVGLTDPEGDEHDAESDQTEEEDDAD